MKAAVYHGRHDVRVEAVRGPTDPTGSDIVIEVVRAAICGTDSAEWDRGPILARPPVTLGHEFVGVVVATGPEVSNVKVGDRVVSGSGISCGQCLWCVAGRTNLCAQYRTLGLHVNGGLAEYVTSPAAICVPVPETVSDGAAAIAQPLAVALHALRRSGLRSGQSCAVIGVGGIGAFVVAAAAASGASPLLAIDIDVERLVTAKALGAQLVVNSRGRDLADAIREHAGGDGVDVVIEASGVPAGPAACVAVAKRGGRVVIVGLHREPRALDLLSMTVREIELTTSLAHVCDADLPEALGLLCDGKLAAAVTEKTIGLDDLVEHGLRPLAAGTARGKILVAP